jgi:predicted acetyltransferase
MDQMLLQISAEPVDAGTLEDGDLRLELARFATHAIHGVPAYHFRMVHGEGGAEMGNINLRLGWDDNLVLYAGHVGYGVNQDYRGHGYAARAVRLLAPLAQRHGFPELWITCDPGNTASRRTCERAGARLVEIIEVPAASEMYRLGITHKCRYRLGFSS